MIGRAPGADLHVPSPRASALHAELSYVGEAWRIRDLASRNGTWVDGVRLVGAAVTLGVGSRIELAGTTWRLLSAGPPLGAAVPIDGGPAVEEEDGAIVLSDGVGPTLLVARDLAGGWRRHDGDVDMPANDGELVEVGGRRWRLALPTPHLPTLGSMAGDADAEVAARFAVSRDEEHVRLTVRWGSREVTPRPAAHAYTLLTLARARLADEEAGILPPAERGWIHRDELCRRLRLDPNLLLSHLFRARRQLADLEVPGADALFERRLDARQLRVGLSRIEVVPL